MSNFNDKDMDVRGPVLFSVQELTIRDDESVGQNIHRAFLLFLSPNVVAYFYVAPSRSGWRRARLVD